MIKMIAAVSSNGIIGKDGKIPWDYPEDMKFFRETTKNSIVIMGRGTFESMDCKPLPNRRNIIVQSKSVYDGSVIVHSNFDTAMTEALTHSEKDKQDIWLIGGASIYEAGMDYASEINLTLIPEVVGGFRLVRFPWINPAKFRIESTLEFFRDVRLKLVTYKKVTRGL